MARFITRVELHGASYADYENLHRFMAEAKFQRTIPGDNGVTYTLPNAEYYAFGNLSASDVCTLAQRAAARTGRGHWVLVTEANDIAWTLKPAFPTNALAALSLRPAPVPPPSPLATNAIASAFAAPLGIR